MSGRRILVHVLILGAFVAAMQLQMQMFRGGKSITYDETFYIACATNTVARGRLDTALVDHGTAPLPILVHGVPAVVSQTLRGGWVEPRHRRWQHERGDRVLIDRARLINSWVVGTGLLVTVYLWLLSGHGTMAALSGAMFVAFSPTILAHTSLATTDSLAALSWLAALWAIARFGRAPSALRSVLAGAAVGLAVSAKYSGVLLGIVFLLVMIRAAMECPLDEKRRRLHQAVADATAAIFVFFCVAFVAAWAVHGFSTARIEQSGVYSVPTEHWMTMLEGIWLPAPIVGILYQQLHNLAPPPAMLWGEVSNQGWWYYYPMAAAIKATPSEAVAVIVGLAAAFWNMARPRRETIDAAPRATEGDPYNPLNAHWSATVWGLALFVGAAFVLLVRVQIGIRYLLPLAMTATLFCSANVGCLMGLVRGRAVRRSIAALWAILLFGQFATAASIAPHYLAYVAPYWGGSSEGFRRLADSNVDWGQDLPALRRVLSELPSDRVVLSYFGTAEPAAYGIEAVTLEQVRRNPRLSLADYDYLAVSINHLYGIDGSRDGGDLGLRHPLHEHPVARAGHSILVFEMRGL